MGSEPEYAATEIEGLDAILHGGFPRQHAYLLRGDSGSGKTTLAMQFCLAGARQGERTLFLSTCESEAELHAMAHSHGWSLDGMTIHYHDVRECLEGHTGQSVFHPVEVELPQTIDALLSLIDRVDPQRLVIDSLSEIRLAAGDPLWFRRQMLALKDNLAARPCTALFTTDARDPDQTIKSIAHGLVQLEQLATDYGPDRRRLRVAKLRGQTYASGYHDFRIRTGGIEVYPRLVAAEHRGPFASEVVSSGLPELDALAGGGLDRGTATLLLGPAGTGKSTVASQCVVAATQRGERAAMYVFDERIQTLLERTKGLGLDLQGQIDAGRVEVQQVDPAELTPGEFSHAVHQAIAHRGVRLVVIDSLAGYVHAMPNERLLTLHLHELLSYLGQEGVTVLMVMAQHGLPGTLRHAPFDVSYIADSVFLFHLWEHAGELCKAISVYKRRSGGHEATLRPLQFGPQGISFGDPLRWFSGMLTGTPHLRDQEARPHVQ
ncbi:MAG: circadian clock protein KaiC [Planctomycetaceae bacterium]|nr:MAG: circadian clock protein KaiC [Planctomycetaceae bacterium]